MTFSQTINAATHKRVFYRIIRGTNEEIESKCQNLANLINKYNGRVYGTTVMDSFKVIISFEIPTLAVEQFLNEEQALRVIKSENKT